MPEEKDAKALKADVECWCCYCRRSHHAPSPDTCLTRVVTGGRFERYGAGQALGFLPRSVLLRHRLVQGKPRPTPTPMPCQAMPRTPCTTRMHARTHAHAHAHTCMHARTPCTDARTRTRKVPVIVCTTCMAKAKDDASTFGSPLCQRTELKMAVVGG